MRCVHSNIGKCSLGLPWSWVWNQGRWTRWQCVYQRAPGQLDPPNNTTRAYWTAWYQHKNKLHSHTVSLITISLKCAHLTPPYVAINYQIIYVTEIWARWWHKTWLNHQHILPHQYWTNDGWHQMVLNYCNYGWYQAGTGPVPTWRPVLDQFWPGINCFQRSDCSTSNLCYLSHKHICSSCTSLYSMRDDQLVLWVGDKQCTRKASCMMSEALSFHANIEHEG